MAEAAAEQVEVDGETFAVAAHPALPGRYDVAWLTGKSPGYGFTTRTSDGSPLTRDQVVEQIRSFLAEIDERTGYLAD